MPQVLRVGGTPPPPRPPSGPGGLVIALVALTVVLLIAVTVLGVILFTRPGSGPRVVAQNPAQVAVTPALPAAAPASGQPAVNPIPPAVPGAPADPRLSPSYSPSAAERRRLAEERRRRRREERLRNFAPPAASQAQPMPATTGGMVAISGLPPSHTLSSPAYPQQPYVSQYGGTRSRPSHPAKPAANPGFQPVAASAQDVVARVKGSVVLVLADTPEGIGSGTGFVVGASQVATCAHVIEGARRVLVITGDGRQIAAFQGARDAVNDVAVLNCGVGLPPPVRLGNSDLAREGDEVAVTGYPVVDKFLALGYAPTSSTTFGRINARRVRMQSGFRVEELQTDASINPGNSGGPVYSTRDGQVVGLASSMLAQERGIGFASTVNALRRLLGR